MVSQKFRSRKSAEGVQVDVRKLVILILDIGFDIGYWVEYWAFGIIFNVWYHIWYLIPYAIFDTIVGRHVPCESLRWTSRELNLFADGTSSLGR